MMLAEIGMKERFEKALADLERWEKEGCKKGEGVKIDLGKGIELEIEIGKGRRIERGKKEGRIVLIETCLTKGIDGKTVSFTTGLSPDEFEKIFS
jgi:hypothetical protein